MSPAALALALLLAAHPPPAPVDPCADASEACRVHRTLGVELLGNKLKLSEARLAECEATVKAQAAALEAPPPAVVEAPPPEPEHDVAGWLTAGAVGAAVGALAMLALVGVAR